MLSIFKPAPHKARLPAAEIDPTYRRLRWQIFLGIFFGYAAYYLVRKNFALAMPYLVEQGFSRGDLGFALSGISIAYGFSKFIMGSVSDRSNPRVFLPAGLILAAAVMLFMGFVPWATSSIAVMFVLLFLCGWFQGMGWPPCGRTMVHWWSQKERGGIVSVWNCAHNVGGGIPPLLFLLGMAWFNDWHAALYMPAFCAILVALFAFAMMRDTPQSCGLPPIEEYKMIIRTTITKSGTGADCEANLHAVRAAEQTAVVHRYRQRVRLSAALRHPRLVTDLSERGETLRAG